MNEFALEKETATERTRLIGVTSIGLLGSQRGAIRKLSGFKKGLHKVPDSIDDYTQSFVERIATDDLTQEALRTHEQLKINFGYKRKEISLTTRESVAGIATKDFDLRITYTQDREDAKSYVIEYLITDIRNARALQDEGLQHILGRHFDEVRFSVEGAINLEALIDSLEAEDTDGVILAYPADCRFLTISLRDRNWSLRLSGEGISIVNRLLGPPALMFFYLEEAQGLLTGIAKMLSITITP